MVDLLGPSFEVAGPLGRHTCPRVAQGFRRQPLAVLAPHRRELRHHQQQMFPLDQAFRDWYLIGQHQENPITRRVFGGAGPEQRPNELVANDSPVVDERVPAFRDLSRRQLRSPVGS